MVGAKILVILVVGGKILVILMVGAKISLVLVVGAKIYVIKVAYGKFPLRARWVRFVFKGRGPSTEIPFDFLQIFCDMGAPK